MTTPEPPIRHSTPARQPETPAMPEAPEEAEQPVPDEHRTVTGRNPDGERAGAWAASGELAQRPSAPRRAEEQQALPDPTETDPNSEP